MMTLEEFMDAKEDCDVTVYSHNQPLYFWHIPDDPRMKCGVLHFGIVSETELWVEIDEEIH